jgi:molybdopterin molybdotransferase
MLDFSAAKQRLLGEVTPLATQIVPLDLAAGRVLRVPLVADRMQPPFDRVMMDGFAMRVANQGGSLRYRVAGICHAGQPAAVLPIAPGSCMEVMTGAILPLGADCVVPIEQVARRDGDEILLSPDARLAAGVFIHKAGSDMEAGREVVAPGVLLGAREIGVAASLGYAMLEVASPPSIGIVATGDELVAVAARPLPHQIRQSNGHALAAALRLAGYPPDSVTQLGDDAQAAPEALRAIMDAHDWVVLTGAVSKGARDFIPQALARLGCRCVFHGVAQRPGKPMGCWIGPRGQVLIALPGNPVSAVTNLHVLALPALDHAAGRTGERSWPVLPDGLLPAHPGFTLHLPVRINRAGRAEAAATSNSGDFIGLLRSSGCVTIPPRPEHELQPLTLSYTPWL